MVMWLLQQHIIMFAERLPWCWNISYYHLLTQAIMPILNWGTNQTVDLFKSFNPAWSSKVFYIKLEWAASNGNRYPPYPQVMATAISQ